jgi:hypothetical protein
MGNITLLPMGKRLGGPYSQFKHFGTQKISCVLAMTVLTGFIAAYS